MLHLRLLGGPLIIVLLTLNSLFEEPAELPQTGPKDANLASFDKLMTTFVHKNDLPGAALAVAKDGRVVYSRGFGFADREKKEPVRPNSLFRIASISKPITAAAILQLVERKKLKLDDKVFEVLELVEPNGAKFDGRWKKVTILQLLQHTGGWNRDRKGAFDPMFYSPEIVKELKVRTPADAHAIIRFMLRLPLDFDPGTEYHYSNFGYCLLGRVVEKVSGQSYEDYVQKHVLAPLGIENMRLGHTLLRGRAEGEVKYYVPERDRPLAIMGTDVGKPVPEPYGAWNLEAMDSHGGWIASAADLVRFASAFDHPKKCKILNEKSIEIMFARPEGEPGKNKSGNPSGPYYACGWEVHPFQDGTRNTWHGGSLPGSSTLLVRRADGLTWAVLFNSRNMPGKVEPADAIDPLLHDAADAVKKWPK
jgi:CubicO group peptidase (beta-lactamase class C family)